MDSRIPSVGEQIAERAWSFVGTPWIHQGRRKGVGVDCIGMVIGAVKEVDDFGYDHTSYSMDPNWPLLKSQMEMYAGCVSSTEEGATPAELKLVMEPGDILVFNLFGQPRHVGMFVGDNTFLHSFATLGEVAPFQLNGKWLRRMFAVYRYNYER